MTTMLLLAYLAVITPYEAVFDGRDETAENTDTSIDPRDLTIDCFFLLDIIVNFRTGHGHNCIGRN